MAWEAKQNRNCHRKWNRFVCLFSSCFFLARLGFSWFDHINVNMRERASMRWLKRFVAHKTPSTNADGIANGAAIKKKLHHFNYVCVCVRVFLCRAFCAFDAILLDVIMFFFVFLRFGVQSLAIWLHWNAIILTGIPHFAWNWSRIDRVARKNKTTTERMNEQRNGIWTTKM